MCFWIRSHFRRDNSADVRGHPAYIYKRSKGKYHYVGLTHGKYTNHLPNVTLDSNPEPHPKDPRPSRLRPFSSEEDVGEFGDRLRGWRFSKSDKPKVKASIANHKKPK